MKPDLGHRSVRTQQQRPLLDEAAASLALVAEPNPDQHVFRKSRGDKHPSPWNPSSAHHLLLTESTTGRSG